MKYKLNPDEREERIERRAVARASAAARVDEIRDWFQQRRNAAAEKAAQAADDRRGHPRGIDRVPARYASAPGPRRVYLVEHTGPNYLSRRRWALGQGRALPSSSNVPHVSPDRDRRSAAAGRLRKELQP